MPTDSELSAQAQELESEQIRLSGDEPMDDHELEGIIGSLIQ